MRNLTGERFLDGGTVDSGCLGGICCRKFLPFEGFEPALKHAESECIYRYANLLLPIRVRFPQCSLEWGPRDSLTTPVSLWVEDGETSYSYLPPEMLDRAACRIRTRF